MTVRTMAFLFIGLMRAVLLVGVPFHLLGVWIGKRFFDWPKVPVTSRRVRQITRVSTALLVAQVVVTCYATKLGYQGYFS